MMMNETNPDYDPRGPMKETFERSWNEIRATVNPSEFPESALRVWWETLIRHEPNYSILAQNLFDFTYSPYLSLLTVWLYGYAEAIDAMMGERINPATQGPAPRLPEWLEQMVLEDLKKKYSTIEP